MGILFSRGCHSFMKKTITGVLLISLLTGCSYNYGANADKTYDINKHTDTVRISSPSGHRSEDVQEWSMYEQNPNLLNTNGDKKSDRSDINQARSTINKLTDYEPGGIWIDGEYMHVTVYTNKDFSSKAEREKAEESLQKKLVGAVPTYYINVKIREDHTD